jgi:hypothetical protein
MMPNIVESVGKLLKSVDWSVPDFLLLRCLVRRLIQPARLWTFL